MIIQCQPDMAEAISLIFKHENISYSRGVGPGCISIEIDIQDRKKAKKAISEWKFAVDLLYQEIHWSDERMTIGLNTKSKEQE